MPSDTYELILPDKYRLLHSVFSINNLEKWTARDGQDKMPLPDLDNDAETLYEVEEVKDRSKIDGKIHYLVKWSEWPSEYNTWEPEDNLDQAQGAIRKWLARQKKGAKTNQVLAEARDPDLMCTDSSIVSDDSDDSVLEGQILTAVERD